MEVPERKPSGQGDPANGNGFPMNEIILRFDKMMHGRQKMEKREMSLKEAVPILTELESEKLISEDDIKRQALWSVEQEGIVFIDEIDKICSRGTHTRARAHTRRRSARPRIARDPRPSQATTAARPTPPRRACSATCCRC